MFLSGGPKQYKVPLLLYKNYSIYAFIRIDTKGPELEKCYFEEVQLSKNSVGENFFRGGGSQRSHSLHETLRELEKEQFVVAIFPHLSTALVVLL